MSPLPGRSTVASPARLASPQGAAQSAKSGTSGAATIIPPNGSPGIAAESMPPATPARVPRSISPTPMAMTASDQSDSARVTGPRVDGTGLCQEDNAPAARTNTPV